MTIIENKTFEGERSLFKTNDAIIKNSIFQNGESPLKESRDLKINNCTFKYKYPLWYGKNFSVKETTFELMSRSGIRYTNNSVFENINFLAPKFFRRCNDITINNSIFEIAEETFWNSSNIKIKNTNFLKSSFLFMNSININLDKSLIEGDYSFMNTKDVLLENSTINGNYAFDGAENITVKNCILNSKDAFWNTKNVYVENTSIDGEYLAWNSTNIEFVNCTLTSHQGLCYIKKLTIKNSKLIDSDLTFEYCEDIDASLNNIVLSIKNPISGVIKAKGIKDFIFDDPKLNIKNTKIITEETYEI